jgi:hypothetical protein
MMDNGKMPAMPIEIDGHGQYAPEAHTEDKTVQEFQNGQEVLWHKGKAFYVGESKEKGKSVIETITNQGIHGTTYTQVTVNTASLSIVENKQEIQHKDLKQLKELLDLEINNWFNKLS